MQGYLREKQRNKILYKGTFATKIPGGFFSNALAFNPKNTANTNVIYWAGKLLALWEGGLPHRMEADSLRTVGPYTIKGVST